VSSRRIEFIDCSVDWIISHFSLKSDSIVADFGCGPGLYTTRLARNSIQVTGIDFSRLSIEYARQEAAKERLTIAYVCQNYLEFETHERFDLILMIMCDFCALSPEQRLSLLMKYHSLLNPNGVILLDVYSLSAFKQREEESSYGKNFMNGFWSAQPYFGFLNVFKYNIEKVVLDKFTIIEKNRVRQIYNWLQYFSPDSLRMEFEEAGFNVSEVYGDVAGTEFDPAGDEFAVICQKK
jgi:SAM-dependent methyltransferase